MGIISVDLGTTNIKVGAYDNKLDLVTIESLPVIYEKRQSKVEFNPDSYFSDIVNLISKCYQNSKKHFKDDKVHLVLTGQAESLVVLGEDQKPLINGISWLDMRSEKECEELSKVFNNQQCYQITGQPKIIPTWPITKILWLKNNAPEIFAKAKKFLLLKDYILYRLTGKIVGEHSIYPFSCYFNVTKKSYWHEILDYCGIDESNLPTLIKPCSILGKVLPEIACNTSLPQDTLVNVGTLDHFASMIGTGNINSKLINESAGTVSSLATFVSKPTLIDNNIPLYCGPFDESYIYLPVFESGGASMEWYKNSFLQDCSYALINEECEKKLFDGKLFFLPYLTGVNPPEFDELAKGVFYGISTKHDRFDFALSIMYGVACVIRKNIEYFKANGIPVEKIISTGGGAKSSLWTQIKADICNIPIIIPSNEESSSFGAAIIGAIANGYYDDFDSAINETVKVKMTYIPKNNRSFFDAYYEQFCSLYDTLVPQFHKQVSG